MRTRALISLGLFAAVLVVYAQVAGHAFVDYDDFVYVTKNPNLPGGFSWEKVVQAFREPYEANWIPLTWLSLQLDYELFGSEPAGYLLENAFLHACSTVLLFLALLRMTGAIACSAFVAAVFGLHPLHVESVAWVAERKDTLSGLLWMATLYSYAGYVKGGRKAAGYALVLLFLTLGLLAKATAVTLPFVLLLLDYWPLRRLQKDEEAGAAIDLAALRVALLEKLPMIAIVALISVVTFSVQRDMGAMTLGDVLPFELRLMNALQSYFVYVRTSVFPTGLAVLYPHPLESLSPLVTASAALFLLAVTGGVLRVATARPYLLVGWLWYVGTLVPVIGLVQVGGQARADRYMYFPLIGLAIMLAWAARDFAGSDRRRQKWLVAAALVSVVAMSAASYVQIGYWRNTQSLFERALAVTEGNYFAHRQLGEELIDEGQFEAALVQLLAYEKLRPRSAQAKFSLGALYEKWGQLDRAAAYFKAGLHGKPDDAVGLEGMGVVRVRQGRFEEALEFYQRAVVADPDSASIHEGLGIIFDALGKTRDAVRHDREALRLDPERPTAANNLAWLLATTRDETLRDPGEAIRRAETALRLSEAPEPGVLDTLAAAYAADGRFEDALRTSRRAARMASDAGQPELAAEIESHVVLYESGKALRL